MVVEGKLFGRDPKILLSENPRVEALRTSRTMLKLPKAARCAHLETSIISDPRVTAILCHLDIFVASSQKRICLSLPTLFEVEHSQRQKPQTRLDHSIV